MPRPEKVEAIPAGPLATRLITLEAVLFLLAARMLIAGVRFGRWRRLLGRPVNPDGPAFGVPAQPMDRYLARATDRAADRLPLDLKCLPRAMALQWMLHRRERPGELVIAAIPPDRRTGSDDFHAWVEIGDTCLINQSYEPYQPLLRLRFQQSGDQDVY